MGHWSGDVASALFSGGVIYRNEHRGGQLVRGRVLMPRGVLPPSRTRGDATPATREVERGRNTVVVLCADLSRWTRVTPAERQTGGDVLATRHSRMRDNIGEEVVE
jgi:hypothetical protein